MRSLVLGDHSGLTWMTFTEDSAGDVTSKRWKSLLVMMKTMEEELKVTLFLGLFLLPHELETTMGLIGRSTGAKGRSLKLCCSQDNLEHSSCSKQRRNCEARRRKGRNVWCLMWQWHSPPSFVCHAHQTSLFKITNESDNFPPTFHCACLLKTSGVLFVFCVNHKWGTNTPFDEMTLICSNSVA